MLCFFVSQFATLITNLICQKNICKKMNKRICNYTNLETNNREPEGEKSTGLNASLHVHFSILSSY